MVESSIIDQLIKKEDKQKTDLINSLEMLINDKFIEGKTILDNKQVTAITLMNWAGQVYDIPFLRSFVGTWVKYRISGDNGRGRGEIIQIAQAIQLKEQQDIEKMREMLGK